MMLEPWRSGLGQGGHGAKPSAMVLKRSSYCQSGVNLWRELKKIYTDLSHLHPLVFLLVPLWTKHNQNPGGRDAGDGVHPHTESLREHRI